MVDVSPESVNELCAAGQNLNDLPLTVGGINVTCVGGQFQPWVGEIAGSCLGPETFRDFDQIGIGIQKIQQFA